MNYYYRDEATTGEYEDFSSRFKWPEYLVFSLTLALSAGIGIFFGFFQKNKNKTTEDFLMGGRSLTTFPVSMSLIASFMSAITLLGNPVEIYQYGTQYWLLGFCYIFVMASACYWANQIFRSIRIPSRRRLKLTL